MASALSLDDDPAFPDALTKIDWAAPWLAPCAMLGRAYAEAAAGGAPAWRARMNAQARGAALRSGRGLPLHFIAQSALPAGEAYEAHIARTGGVPTRSNLHDFFNALAWFHFPLAKAVMNARQAAEIERLGIAAERGVLRDALTLADENLALVPCADVEVAEALRRFDWRTAFVERRAAWGSRCEALLPGHALVEKLVSPYKSITAHALIIDVPAAYFAWAAVDRLAFVDAGLANVLAEEGFRSARFTPLPVLGVPGFFPANADDAFYDDTSVFRAGRRRPG